MDARRVRYVAAGAAGVSAVLYYLIGFGVLDIGESTTGETTDLLGFGLMTGTVFIGVALVALFIRNKWMLGAVGLLDAAVIIFYFAVASVREPPFEAWGLTIKVLQVVVVIAIGMAVFARPATPERRPAPRTEALTPKASPS